MVATFACQWKQSTCGSFPILVTIFDCHFCKIPKQSTWGFRQLIPMLFAIYGCHYLVLPVEAKYMWIWPNLCHLWLPLGYLVLPVEAKYDGQRGCGDFWLHNQQLPLIPKITFCVHNFCCALFKKINIIWLITSGSLHRTNYSFQLLQLTLCMALMGDTHKCTSTACSTEL